MKKYFLLGFLSLLLISCCENHYYYNWNMATNGKLPILLMEENGSSTIISQMTYNEITKLLEDKTTSQQKSILVFYDYASKKIVDKNGAEVFLFSSSFDIFSPSQKGLPFFATSLVTGSLYYDEVLENTLDYSSPTIFQHPDKAKLTEFEVTNSLAKNQNLLVISYVNDTKGVSSVNEESVILDFDHFKIYDENVPTNLYVSITNAITYTVSYVTSGATYPNETLTTPHILITYKMHTPIQ